MASVHIWFLATSRSGLGHLRRVATIARAIRVLAADRVLHLVSNAEPRGLPAEDIETFDDLHVAERAEMAGLVASKAADTEPATMVLDTITVPGIEAISGPLVLMLREMPDEKLSRFHLAGGRRWDRVIVANPAGHWLPDFPAHVAAETCPVGWIYRRTQQISPVNRVKPMVLVATGGGGTADTAAALYASIDHILRDARQRSGRLFEVVQAIGPRARDYGQLAEADRVIDPGGTLNDLFAAADVVVSTVGYNSVLELACTDVPVLLIPIPRSIDDQAARTRIWGPILGKGHADTAPESSALWLSEQIVTRSRRPPVDLGQSGEDLAAKIILELG